MSKKNMSKSRKKLDRPALERVAKVFSSFSDATRLAILQELLDGTRSVGELVEALGDRPQIRELFW